MKLLKNITLNLILGLNVFILFFLLAEGRIVIPPALQVLGRMHPLLLHFPIVLLFLALVFEVFNGYLNEDSTPSAVMDPGSSKTRRSEEHTYQLQQLMPHTYAVYCLKQ